MNTLEQKIEELENILKRLRSELVRQSRQETDSIEDLRSRIAKVERKIIELESTEEN